MLYLLTNNLEQHFATIRLRQLPWNCFGRLCSIYNRAKANEETADKTTDEVWAGLLKIKKEKLKYKIIGTYKTTIGLVTLAFFEKKVRSIFNLSAHLNLQESVFYKDGNYVVKWKAYSCRCTSLFTYDTKELLQPK
jgi:hypothetical protein